MKIFSKMNLQWRITFLAASILLLCSTSITFFSLYSARQTLYPFIAANVVSIEDVEPSTEEQLKGAVPAVPTVPAEQLKLIFDMKGILFCVFITLLGTAAVYYVSGRALKPIRSLCKSIKQIDENNLSIRLQDTDVKDELGQLTTSFNHMLDRLEEAFVRQKRFASSVAHEIKTPLAIMKAGMQVLRRDEGSSLCDYQENADVVVKNVDRLSELINELLYWVSREEKENYKQEQIELDVMLEAIFSELELLYEEQNIISHLEIQENELEGNSAMLYRAFYNLIENAYKYNKIGGSIHIRASRENTYTIIEVTNTGKVIPEEQLHLIFEPFYRVDASRSREIAGAGLGLSIVKTVINKHEGSISVVSQDGQGTTFRVALPGCTGV